MKKLDKRTVIAIIFLWLLFSAYVMNADPIYVGGIKIDAEIIEVTLFDAGIYGKYCSVDYGQNITYANQNRKKNLLTDEFGKKIKLKTTIQIIKYFTEKGYKLMDKDISSSSQTDPMLGGNSSYSETSFLFIKSEK